MTNISSLERWLTEHRESMTTEDVARVLNLVARTIREMVRRGELPVVRVGKRSGGTAHFSFRTRDIVAYLEARTTSIRRKEC